MIDLHCHLIPSVDDGSKSYEESRRMLEDAANEGITEIIITPHFIKESSSNIKRKEMLERFEELKKRNQDLDVKLYLGNELFIDYELDEIIEKKEVSSLNDSDYVLVEFPFTSYLNDYDEYLYNISLNRKIIIAHPERYEYVQKDPFFVHRWLENRYLLQVNQDSFFRSDTKKTANKLIKEGYVSFIASDGHSLRRPVTLRRCHKYISEKYGKDLADMLMQRNPEHVINNGICEKPVKVKRRWF